MGVEVTSVCCREELGVWHKGAGNCQNFDVTMFYIVYGIIYDVTVGCVAIVLHDLVHRTGLLLPRSSSTSLQQGLAISSPSLCRAKVSWGYFIYPLTSALRKPCYTVRQNKRPNQRTTHGGICFAAVTQCANLLRRCYPVRENLTIILDRERIK